MSSSIDNRVVQMTFDNASFEKKLDTTIASLDRLEKSLNFEKSQKNLQALGAEASRFNLGNISTNIEGVSKKFLALSTIAVTALSQITSAALRTGTQMAKSLSTDLIMQGFKEYELNIGSIQTILANTASKGTTLTDVTKALDELNEYSDKTIYNFAEMTRNIGTFSAAGVELETSVQSIKGIANLAAISGSNSQQASTAMYQLSQAIAAGSVKLIDWNSVVNAGMGGEVFQKALFETGKALKTIEGVGIDTTFEQWTAAGNTFRGSLEKGWVTADVLTTTLKGFTGELSEAQLVSLGYTEAQAKEIIKLGQLGVDSATKVRTLTQLIATVKESIGSGWSQSFRIIFGDFEEATELFTKVSNAIGGFVGANSEARNSLLQGWKNLGGRIILIETLQTTFKGLASIIKPISDAFKEFFPPVTAQRLFDITMRFRQLAERLIIFEDVASAINRVFRGIFAGIKIGIAVVKGIFGVFKELFGLFASKAIDPDEGALGFLAKIGDFIVSLKESLVDGGKIEDFFTRLTEVIKNPIPFLIDLKNKIVDFFKEFLNIGGIGGTLGNIELPGAGPLEGVLDRLSQRFDGLRSAASKFGELWDGLSGRFSGIKDVLVDIWEYIADWFGSLGDKLAEGIDEGEFDAAVDAVNVGLLGGIVYILKKFLDDGLKIDLGDGLFDKISGAFEELTGVLSAMQANLKAEALLKIAAAIALLTASVLVLSMIDSAALTKALVAISVGLGQLMAVMAAMNKITGPSGAVGLVGISTGLILISAAMLVFSLAVKSFADLSWEELSRGLSGMAGGLAIMVGVVLALSKAEGPMVRAGLAMILIATGMRILAEAVAAFAEMSWAEIGRGLTVLAASLLAIGLALALVPASAPLIGAGILLVAVAMTILGKALQSFADMSWEEIGRGLATMAGALLVIAIALGNPALIGLPLTAAGLVIASAGLLILAQALKEFATIKGGDAAKAIAIMAGALLVVAIGVTAMVAALPGAAALLVVAAGMWALFEVVKAFGSLKINELLMGLAGMAAVLTVLGLAALIMQPIIPMLLLLGAAMTLIGAGFALFGAGALLVAKSIEILAKVGAKGMAVIFQFIDGLLERAPEMATVVAKSLLNLVQTLLDGSAPIIEALGILLGQIIDTMLQLAPKFYELAGTIITNILTIIREKAPEFIETGLTILIALLTGIRDNIGEIVDLAADIIINFLKGLEENTPDIARAGANLIIAFLQAIANEYPRILRAGVNLLIQFVAGLAGESIRIANAAISILIAFANAIVDNIIRIANAGASIVIALVNAIGDNIYRLIDAGTDFIVQILQGIGESMYRITDAAVTLVVDFIEAMTENLDRIRNAGVQFLVELIAGIGEDLDDLITAAVDVIEKFVLGLSENIDRVIEAGTTFVEKFLEGLGKNAKRIAFAASKFIYDILVAIRESIEYWLPKYRDEGIKIGWALLDGMTFGIAGKAKGLAETLVGAVTDPVGTLFDKLGIRSPSKVMMEMGEYMIMGLTKAFNEDDSMEKSAVALTERSIRAFNSAFAVISEIGSFDEFNPTITPVLDLTPAQEQAKAITSWFGNPAIEVATNKALELSRLNEQVRLANVPQEPTPVEGPREVKYEQNIYAPTELSAAMIYRQTRSQLALAKEELGIP